MRWRLNWYPWGPLCCGVISALAAVYLMQLYIDQQLRQQPAREQLPARESQLLEVVVAREALLGGDLLSLQSMSVRQVGEVGVAADTLHPSEASWLVGQRLAHPVEAGQPIQRLHLQGPQVSHFSSLLQPGQRALTLNVNAQQSHAGLIRVGDHVDFYDLSGSQPELLDTEIKVIATGPKFTSGSSQSHGSGEASYPQADYRTLTFAITASQAPLYDMLQRSHQLAFWLRAPEDSLAVTAPRQVRQTEWIIGGREALMVEPALEPSWL